MSVVVWSIVLGYALGAVPFAFLVARAAAGVDLRRVGSGNVGATNVLRTTRRSAAAVALALDMLKGAAAALVAGSLGGESAAAWAGGAAVVGHVYPVWLAFQGGKGVATAAGACAVIAPAATLVAVVAFALVAGLTRRASAGSLASCVALPAAAWAGGASRTAAVASLVVAALILFRHRENVARLAAGTEPRLGDRAG